MMAGIVIDESRCVGCGLCVKTCPQGAIEIKDKKAHVGESCIACGMCLDSCKLGAISRMQEKGGEDLDSWKGILVAAEAWGGKLHNVTLELLCKAKELQSNSKCSISAFLMGKDVEKLAQELIDHGVDTVYLCQDESLVYPTEEPWADALASVIEKARPEILLFGATEFGRSLAPRVAARLRTGLTADCTVLEIDKETGLLQQTRPAFGGNLMATIVCPNHRPQMATVRPGVFPMGQGEARQGTVVRLPVPALSGRVQVESAQPAPQSKTIADAQIIVAVGRGIGSQKNMQYAYELARLLGGQVSASRPLVDAGWAQYPMQVGQTGKTVAPKLYIACGISGAIQHLAGIGGAETIVAINTDPDAPIFQSAHYAIVGDCVEVLKEMIAQLQK